jgi:hypothetical protein
MINTTHGLQDESQLARTLGFEERPGEFVVWVEWRMPEHADCAVCRDTNNPQPVNGAVLVRRDAHVILKQPTVTADAIVGGL